MGSRLTRNTKQRWGRKKEDEQIDMNEDEKKTSEEEDVMGRQVYDMRENVLEFGKMRVTDTGRHRRTVLPKERSVEEESEFEVRKNAWMAEYDRVMEEICDEEGNVKDGTLNGAPRRGLKKLCKRVKDGEIVVTKTDKSGRLFVSSMEGYTRGGMKHVGVDKEVTMDEARVIERRMRNLGELWVKGMGVGVAHGEKNVTRVRKAFTTEAGAVPPLYTMQKDYKPKVEGEEWPPSRPVCGACMAATSRVGDLVCGLVERVADGVNCSCESKSGEDMMAWMEDTNGVLREEAI